MTPGSVSVTVVEQAAVYRRGLEHALAAAQYKVVDPPDDPASWAGAGENRIVVITFRNAAACTLTERAAAGSGRVLALLPEPTLDAYTHALRHGATSAVDWNADPEEILSAVAAAAAGRTLLPTEIVKALAKRGSNAHTPVVDREEIAWLEALAAGATVVELADKVGYSERSMFRKLHELYGRLGVTSRSGALIEAERLGLLTAPSFGVDAIAQ